MTMAACSGVGVLKQQWAALLLVPLLLVLMLLTHGWAAVETDAVVAASTRTRRVPEDEEGPCR